MAFIGLRRQRGGHLGLGQLEDCNDAPLNQLAQRAQLRLSSRREEERLDMHLEVGQNGDFRPGNLPA